jgi:FSR family fosmidomycin resistance protein-like MFS transporter
MAIQISSMRSCLCGRHSSASPTWDSLPFGRSTTIGGLLVPADRYVSRLKPRSALALSTFVAAVGFVAMVLLTGFAGLCVGLVLAGVGSSVQHPRASELVTRSYGAESRGALGIYSFAGDWGKPPFLQSLLFYYRCCPGELSLGLWAFSGFSSPPLALRSCRMRRPSFQSTGSSSRVRKSRSGFSVLLSISVLDTATRMGTFCFSRFSSMRVGDRQRRSVSDWRYCSLVERWGRRVVAGSVSAWERF